MTVVNCKVENIRPYYHDLRDWMSDPKNVYIGRGGVVLIDGQRFPPTASPFCNPFKVGVDGSRDDVIRKYKSHIKKKIKSDTNLRQQLLELKGKSLGCWCAPELCHGDVLLKFIEKS